MDSSHTPDKSTRVSMNLLPPSEPTVTLTEEDFLALAAFAPKDDPSVGKAKVINSNVTISEVDFIALTTFAQKHAPKDAPAVGKAKGIDYTHVPDESSNVPPKQKQNDPNPVVPLVQEPDQGKSIIFDSFKKKMYESLSRGIKYLRYFSLH